MNTATSLFRGLLYAIVSMLIMTVLFSVVLWLSGMKETNLAIFAYIIHLVALLIGGFIAGKQRGSKGWYNGGLMGVVYFLMVILIGYLGFDASLELSMFILLAIALIAASLGGMIGVNMHQEK